MSYPSGSSLMEAWKDALAGDPVSAFGGVLITNGVIDKEAAEEINKIVFEVIIAPDYDVDALVSSKFFYIQIYTVCNC